MKHLLALCVVFVYLIGVEVFYYETPKEGETYFTDKLTVKEVLVKSSKTKPKPRPTDQKEERVTMLVSSIRSIYGKNVHREEAVRIVRAAHRYGNEFNVDPTLVLGLIGAESSYNKTARSHVGALGYTQVWPKWHQDKIRGRDILDTEVNIEVGTRYLRDCLNRFGSEYKALACYNGALHRDGRVMKVAADNYFNAVKNNQRRIVRTLQLAGL